MPQPHQHDEKLKVFVSYSRRDSDFAQELLNGLQFAGFAPYLDKHDIAAGENWEMRLGRLIEAADAVVYIISPDSIGSQRCAWEVQRTIELKKRLLPVVWRQVEEALVPPPLKQLNYIFFDRPLTFVASLQVLVTALRTDIDWIREHTRLGEAALRWNEHERPEALLIRGEELSEAKAWLKAQPKYAVEPTLLMLEFINSSSSQEDARLTAERIRLDQLSAAIERERAAQSERELAIGRERKALRTGQHALIGAAALFACIVIGAVGWLKQDYLVEQYHWRFNMNPTILTHALEGEKAAIPGAAFQECKNGCPTMIVITAGNFRMGSPPDEPGRHANEGPQTDVTIEKPFAVSRSEVTFAEWDHCVEAGRCPALSDNNWGRVNRPVINVNWEHAKLYVAWLAGVTGKPYRLLSEAEWEYAARADSTGPYSFGDQIEKLSEYAWYEQIQTEPVMRKLPNAFGLFDMHGNVLEWVEDCFKSTYAGRPMNGSALIMKSCGLRVTRGGSYVYGDPRELGSARRFPNTAGTQLDDVGFRIARSLSN